MIACTVSWWKITPVPYQCYLALFTKAMKRHSRMFADRFTSFAKILSNELIKCRSMPLQKLTKICLISCSNVFWIRQRRDCRKSDITFTRSFFSVITKKNIIFKINAWLMHLMTKLMCHCNFNYNSMSLQKMHFYFKTFIS